MTSTATIIPLELGEAQKKAHNSEEGDDAGPPPGRTLSLANEEEQPKEEHSHAEDSFLDKTLVNETVTSATKHVKASSNESVPTSLPRQPATLEEPWDITKWKPSGPASHQQESTLVYQGQNSAKVHGRGGEEEDSGDITATQMVDLADTDHGLEEGDGAKKVNLAQPPSFSVSRRPSALLISSKAPSPQPWDLIDPPEDNMKGRALPESVAYQLPASGSGKFVDAQLTATGRRLIPKSSYYSGPPPSDTAYGTPPMGHIGVHHPREILRVERDYTGGEVIQFAPIYPLELEGRLTPTQFLESVNSINEVLISAHSLRHAFLDNIITLMSLQLSTLVVSTHFDKELKKLRNLIGDLNGMLFNPVGLNILWPGDIAFQFLEIEYY